MVLALVWWQRAPKVAAVTCAACALFMVDALIGAFLSAALPSTFIERGQNTSQVAVAFAVIGTIRGLLHTVLWCGILFATFSGRGPALAKHVDAYDSGTSIKQ
ncbi:MAG TPA: hypothetical protein VFU22_01175 [Roseiflexaceae bacterium]|nr:hypothetical protein [Roseiflexaceae bacterium]